MHGTALPPPALPPALPPPPLPLPGPTLLRRLLDDVMDGYDVLVLADAAEGRSVLDQAAAALKRRRVRALRVHADAPGGLGVSDLLTQLGGRDPDDQDDRDLQQSFQALTVVDPACDRIALLVSNAHALQPSALRYIQLACRSNAGLRLVLAGAPALLALLDKPGFADLAARMECASLAAATIVAPPASMTASAIRPPVRDPGTPAAAGAGRPTVTPARRSRRGLLAAFGMVVLLLLGIGIGRSTGPAPARPSLATAPLLPAPQSPATLSPAPLSPAPLSPAPRLAASTSDVAPTTAAAVAPAEPPRSAPTPAFALHEAEALPPRPPHPAVRHEPARSVGHAARPGPPRDTAVADIYGRPILTPPELRLPRQPAPYYGWNPADGPAYVGAYIGTYRPNANGARSFTYGP